MSLLDQIAGAVAQVQGNADLNAVRFRHTATWSDGTTCRFGVQDPNKVDSALSRSLRSRPDAPDVRVLRVHQEDASPALAASIPWENGVLFVEHYAQTSDFTGTAPGVCRLVVPTRIASYPLVFVTPGPLITVPSTGNQKPGPGVPLQVVARLEAITDPKLVQLVGADPLTAALFGRWGAPGQPQLRPVGVYWGSTSPLTLQGVAGTLTVRTAFPDDDPVQTAIHGEPFLATWRVDKL
ncbi:hypothetical protein [Deinococcus sp. UYEF24]